MYWTSSKMKSRFPTSRRKRFQEPFRAIRRGFTLIETAMAMMILGIAVAAMLQLLAAGSQSNLAGTELTTAVNLANNIKEISTGLSFTDPNNPTSANTQPG